MRRISLATLRNRITTRYRLPTLGTNSWISTDELNTEINASLQRFYSMLMSCVGDGYFATYEDKSTDADIDVTSLPDGCLRILNVTWLRDTDDPVQLEQANQRDALRSGYVSQSWDTMRAKWELLGNSLRWLPTPNAEYTVRITFTKLPDDLTPEADEFDAGPGWEEWVINDVCVMLCPGEERDPAMFMAARDDAEARIRDESALRGDTSAGLLMDKSQDPVGMGDWERRNWLSRNYP